MSSGVYRPVPLRHEPLDPDESLRRSRTFLESMRTRRTVRHYSADVPLRELVENAIETAGTAPSGANQQPWTFVVVTDAELKRQLRKAAEDEERKLYEGRASEEWLEAIRPLGTGWRKPHQPTRRI